MLRFASFIVELIVVMASVMLASFFFMNDAVTAKKFYNLDHRTTMAPKKITFGITTPKVGQVHNS
jgi:purine-cytosine permease-like protein